MSKTEPALPARRIQGRMVWRLVLCLFGHLTLLLFLATFLVGSLNSVRLYAPVVSAEESLRESLQTVPALLAAMDAERRIWQKSGDPQDKALYAGMRRSLQDNLTALNTPIILPSSEEIQRRDLVRQWLTQVGDVTLQRPPPTAGQADPFASASRELLDEIQQATEKVRGEVELSLSGLKAQEAGDAAGRVTLMWFVVGTVTFITILIQLLLANSIIGPIQSLTAAVRRMRHGDFSTRVQLRSGDEIQGLGETFNAMAENIQSNQRDLELTNASLEKRVAEKTGELEDKNQKLSDAARLKDEFLATLSHELRTPLTPIISCTHLLGSDGDLNTGQLKNVQVIDRNAKALSRMIDELLDLSAVMNRKLRLLRERVELNEWIRATLEGLRSAWEKKGLTLTLLPSGKPVELEVDPTRLAQVLTNLVSNAIKYTPSPGAITVQLSATEEEVRIAVSDTGAGLNRHEIEQIFEMFHQSRTRQTQGVGGLGVGLTVARSLAELHGGGLLATSPGPGLGATFTLWLPRQIEPSATPSIDLTRPRTQTLTAATDRSLLRGRRVLLVEDSTDTREALQRIFLRRECQVTTAGSGEEALEIARHELPEIVISDLGLPGMSGLEFMTQLRAQPEFKDIIAIALTGLGREQDITGAADAGFDTHLLKPVEIAVLDQTLVQALRDRHT